MSLTLRNLKGSPLTWTEGDDNLIYLEGLATGLSSSISGLSFSYVLGVGNETNGNNIVLSDGDVINAENGDGQLDLRYGADSKVMLSTDAGAYSNEYLNMESGYIELSAVDAGGSRINLFADEYGAGIGIGDAGGVRPGDFEVYGKNGFLIESRTSPTEEKLTIKHDDLIKLDTTSIETTATINAATGGGQLDLRNGADNEVMLSNDGGQFSSSQLYFGDQYIELSGYDSNMYIYGNNLELESDDYGIKLSGVFGFQITGLPTYADNAAAVAASYPTNAVYKTATGELRIVV